MTLVMRVPAIVGSRIRPSSTAIQMPFVRLAPPLPGAVVLLFATYALDSDASPSSGFGGAGKFPLGLVWLLMLPFPMAALTNLYPIGFQWSRQNARGIVAFGIAMTVAALVSSAAPWSEDRNLYQLLDQVIFALLGLTMLLGSRLHTPHRVDKACALFLSLAGPLGISLILAAKPDPANSFAGLAAVLISFTLGFLGGLLGAGTYVQELESAGLPDAAE